MTTAETTVKNAFFNSKPESKTPNPRKADDQSKVQSFGDVLGKTAQKFETPKQTTAQAITSSEKPRHSSLTRRILMNLRTPML